MFSCANLPRLHLLTVSSLIDLYTYKYIVTNIIQQKEFTAESTLGESTTNADTATRVNSEFENKKDSTISYTNNSKSKQDLINNEEQE